MSVHKGTWLPCQWPENLETQFNHPPCVQGLMEHVTLEPSVSSLIKKPKRGKRKRKRDGENTTAEEKHGWSSAFCRWQWTDCREGQEGTRGNTCKLRVCPATGSWQAARVAVSFDCGDIVHISWDAGDCVQWKAFAGELRQLPLGANAHGWRWLLGVSREMPWGEQQAHQGLRLSLLVLSASVKGLRAAHLPSSSSSLPLLSSFCLDAFWSSHLLQPKWQRERVGLVPKGGLAPKSPASLPGV